MRLTDFVCSNYSKIFLNRGVDLYMGDTFNDATSCLKMCINLYTSIYGTYRKRHLDFSVYFEVVQDLCFAMM